MIVPENARLEDIGQWGRRFPGWGTPLPTRQAFAYGRPSYPRPRPALPQAPAQPAISSKRRRKLARRAAAAAAAAQEDGQIVEAEDSEMEGIF